MNIGEAVRERIIELCRENDISINKLCTMSGVTQSTVNNIISGRNNSATVSTIKKLCDGLGISIEEFFHSELFRNLEQEVIERITAPRPSYSEKKGSCAMNKTAEKTPAPPHDLILEGRSKLTVTGVKRVLRCDADSAAMETGKGVLHLTGAELNVTSLDLESGEVRLTGRIDALEYTAERTPGGLLRRLLR